MSSQRPRLLSVSFSNTKSKYSKGYMAPTFFDKYLLKSLKPFWKLEWIYLVNSLGFRQDLILKQLQSYKHYYNDRQIWICDFFITCPLECTRKTSVIDDTVNPVSSSHWALVITVYTLSLIQFTLFSFHKIQHAQVVSKKS